MAGRAVVAAGNVIGDFRRCVERRPGGVASAAVARRTFEDRVDMAGLAWQVTVHAVEFEPCRQMIEIDRDRRRLLRLRCDRKQQYYAAAQ